MILKNVHDGALYIGGFNRGVGEEFYIEDPVPADTRKEVMHFFEVGMVEIHADQGPGDLAEAAPIVEPSILVDTDTIIIPELTAEEAVVDVEPEEEVVTKTRRRASRKSKSEVTE